MLRCLFWTCLLTVLTIGIGVVGWLIDPWNGEYGGTHPFLFAALPLLVCLIAVPHPFGWLAGLAAQFLMCLIVMMFLYGIGVVFGRRQ